MTESPSFEDAGAPGQSSAWKVLSPSNPAAVELGTLQRRLAQITRQLANVVDGTENAPDDDRD